LGKNLGNAGCKQKLPIVAKRRNAQPRGVGAGRGEQKKSANKATVHEPGERVGKEEIDRKRVKGSAARPAGDQKMKGTEASRKTAKNAHQESRGNRQKARKIRRARENGRRGGKVERTARLREKKILRSGKRFRKKKS